MNKNNILSFLNKNEIKNIIDPVSNEVIEYLLKKVAFSQPELTSEYDPTGIQMTKEFLESWVAQACNLKKVGAGNYPIDVYKEKDFGADVKFVTAKIDNEGNLTKGISNETSLGQNFSDGDTNLDTLFSTQNKTEILKKWKLILLEKFTKPIKDFELKTIYYFIFIKAGNNIYLSIAKVNSKNLEKLNAGDINKTSLKIENFIDKRYGDVKIYKSKKRMELRMQPKNLLEDELMISWNFTNFKPSVADLRLIVKNKKLKEHIKKELEKFF